MSIKKKFATAVATASLLAGLFGSAFVPSALAAGQSGSASTPKANRTTVAPDGDVFTTFATSKYSFTSYGNNATTGTTSDSSIGFDINYANAAGTSVGITKLESLKAVSSNSAIVVAWGYAEETVLGTPGSNDAGYAQPMDYDSDGDFESPEYDCSDADDIDEGVGDAAEGWYSTTSTVTYVADNSEFSAGQYNLCITAADEDSAGTGTITVTANGVVVKTITVTAVGPLASLELSIAGGYQYVAEDNAAVARWLKLVGKDAAGTVINGTTASASSTTLDFANVAELSTNPKNQQVEAIGFFSEATAVTSVGVPAVSGLVATATRGVQFYSLDASACQSEQVSGDGNGDAGFSYALKVKGTNEDATGITSNAITITCTGNSDYAKITALAPEATTGAPVFDDGALGDDDISIVATVTDGAGRPLGDGAAAFAEFADFDATTATANALDWNDSDDIAAVGGKVDMGILGVGGTLAVRTYSYTVNLQVINFGEVTDEDCDGTTTEADDGDDILDDDTDCTSKSYSFKYTVTDAEAFTPSITVFRNKAKTTARIVMNFGEDEANLEQTIVVEFSNGTITEYYRTANSDGVVSFRLSLRNKTVEVYGDGGSGLTAVKTIVYR
jgi:hypothetical protein